MKNICLPSALHLRRIFIERAQILYGILQFFGQIFNITADVFVIEATLLQNRQLFQHFALYHCNAMLLGHLCVLWFLNQIPEYSQDDTGDLFLSRVIQYIGHNRNDIEFVHFLGQQWIECEHPQAEYQLVLNLHKIMNIR